MRSDFLHFAPPVIREEEVDEVARTLRGGWITTGHGLSSLKRTFGSSSVLRPHSRSLT
jgi:dTDP-4-amino-4,6-dideoxygalactose transaminase